MSVTSIVLAVLVQAAPDARAEAELADFVVDAQGKPVVDAVVFQSGDGPKRTRTTSDGQGRFRLEGASDRPAFLFAWKAGFRFHGQLVGDGSVTLTRTEAAPDAMRTRPSPLPHSEELALARRAIDAYADKVLKEGELNEKVWTTPRHHRLPGRSQSWEVRADRRLYISPLQLPKGPPQLRAVLCRRVRFHRRLRRTMREYVSIEATDIIDLDDGPIGILDEIKLRDVIKSIGHAMESDCETE